MVFIGIDSGTTRIKAAIVSEDGRTIDSVTENVLLYRPSEDFCELDMEKLWDSLCKILLKLKADNLHLWEEIKGIGITGQGDGLWAIDKNGAPACNAILWNDTRTKNLNIQNRDEIDEICVRNRANPLYAGSNIHILKWIQENEPETLAKIDKIFHCKDWLNYKLTEVVSSDYTDMTTALMNLKTKSYVQEILDELGLSQYMGLFAEPRDSAEIIGGVTEQAAASTGLKPGTPVIAGAIDVAAVAYGLGTVQTGDACVIVGTTLANQTVINEWDIDFSKGLILSHILKDRYICIMPTLSGAAAIDWVKELLYPHVSYEEIEKIIAEVPIGSGGIIYHPYLQGERAPFRNPYASGSFFGLKSIHDKADMMRAAFEGLAMSLCDCFESLPETKDRVFISGGAAKNNTICQMISDALGKRIIRVAEQEAGIKGIVTVAKIGLGYKTDLETIDVSIDKEFVPNPENHEQYRQLFRLFKNLRYDYEKHWLERNNLFKEK